MVEETILRDRPVAESGTLAPGATVALGPLPGPLATSDDEAPVYFEAGPNTLFGVVTRPTVAPNHVGVVVVPGGLWVTSTHRNRMFVRLARRLAARGYMTLRVDYRGVGESTGEIVVWELESNFVRDVVGAVDWLRGHGAEQIVLAGSCFGGRNCLAAAEHVADLKGLALLCSPVVGYRGASESLAWHVRQAMRPKTLRRLMGPHWRKKYMRVIKNFLSNGPGNAVKAGKERADDAVSPTYIAHLAEFLKRELPLLIAFGEEGKHYKPFKRAREGTVGELLDAAGDRVTIRIGPGELHGFLSLDHQARAINYLEDWVDSL